MIVIANVWGFVAILMAGVSAASGGSTAGTPNVTGDIKLQTWISGPLAYVSVVLFVFATFRITVPNPAYLPLGDRPSLRRIVRALAIVVAGMHVLNIAIYYSQTSWIMYALGALLQVCTVCATLGLLTYLQSFARMIPNRSLVRSATIVIWGYTTTSIAQIILGLTGGLVLGDSEFSAPIVVPPGMGAFAAMACVITVVFLVFAVWKVILIARTRSEVGRALAQVIRETQEVTAE